MTAGNSSATKQTGPERHGARFAGRPLTWLYVAALGMALAGLGVFIDAYRHDHGAADASVISRSSPGALVALAGASLAAGGLLLALALSAFRDAPSAETVARRAVAVIAAAIVVVGAGVAALTYVVASGLTLGHEAHVGTLALAPTAAGPAATAASATAVPGVDERLQLRGRLTLDGVPIDSPALGANVIRDGLIAACQAEIPTVTGGVYAIGVMSDTESRGCGGPGSAVLLWLSAANGIVYSDSTLPWPSGGDTVFDASFSTLAPDGAVVQHTGFKGHVVHADGRRLAGGTVVEAFIGDTRCGIASVRREPESWFTLLVAGPSVPGCAQDGRITFRVDGAGVGETATNDLLRDAPGPTIELTTD